MLAYASSMGQADRVLGALRRSARWVVPALVFLAIVLVLCWRVWTPIVGARRAFVYDAVWEFWGDLQFQIDAYRHGTLPLWNPWDRAGHPFNADPQAGILYPFNWVVVGLGLIAGPKYWLFSVKTIL